MGTQGVNGLWYIGDRLLIPCTGNICKKLFHLAHDACGHFGSDKSYAMLRNDYYWPNMHRDLEGAYIPVCEECQRNKSPTSKPRGPLHPLPVPEERGVSIALDFIGPLPEDEGKDCILTITDHLGGSDIQIISTHCDISATELAELFFTHWYCKNGLPLNIILDRDKLFVSNFWRALNALTDVKLKMSMAYHLESDGVSEQMNKTINQCLHYYVQHNQRGWVKVLPKIHFDIMNSISSSMGFTRFQLHFGRSLRIIPPLVPEHLPTDIPPLDAKKAQSFLTSIQDNIFEVQDNLLMVKITQAHHTNKNRGPEEIYKIGDRVMLSTFHRRREYHKKGEKRSAKFFPCFDGPYTITACHPEKSTYMLELPAHSNLFPTFHASLLKCFHENDADLFPSREHVTPSPIIMEDGLEEYFVERILDARRQGRGWQFLIHWTGYGPEHNSWLNAKSLEECEALD